ncbi:MAG: DUF2855 family protein [Deltaproteobacteria bacterium]|nr:DUF2855 family protein [Deltaproteobacteria bacterium]
MQGTQFGVRRDDFSRTRFEDVEIDEVLQSGQVLFRVDRFALTSNNISYASAGDMLDYWGFFPADAFPAGEPWGRIPAMGYGDVIRSSHPDVPEGQRAFGFFPMSTHLVIQADRVSPSGYVDVASHRANHAPAYQQYSPVESDALYDEKHEDVTLLLRGLFMTSFLVDDALADADFHGAGRFVIASASSKTAIALASLLSQRGRGPVVGLTSERNRARRGAALRGPQVDPRGPQGGLRRHGGQRRSGERRAPPPGRESRPQLYRRRDALERESPRARPARTRARLLLRAGADPEAQPGVGTRGPAGEAGPRLDPVPRRQRGVAPRAARRGARGPGARVPRGTGGPSEPGRRPRALAARLSARRARRRTRPRALRRATPGRGARGASAPSRQRGFAARYPGQTGWPTRIRT